MAYDMQTLTRIVAGVDTATDLFGALEGQADAAPDPIAIDAVAEYLDARTSELTNKTLNASVGKGTWTADGTWTLPALTLGGVVSGGGQQLNNIIIGTVTPLAGTFTTLTAVRGVLTQGTITDPALNLSGTVTWNDAADTFTGWKLNVTNTNSHANSLLVDLQVGASSLFSVTRAGAVWFGGDLTAGASFSNIGGYLALLGFNGGNGFAIGPGGAATIGSTWLTLNSTKATFSSAIAVGWSSSGDPAPANMDTALYRDAANTLALRNSTNAQKFSIYNTYTDASNYERLEIGWAANAITIAPAAAGTGSSRGITVSCTASSARFGSTGNHTFLDVGNASNLQINFNSSGVTYFEGNSGHLKWNTDNTGDIGASGANRPRNLYVAGVGTFSGNVISAGNVEGGAVRATAGGDIYFVGRTSFASPADGVLNITTNNGTSFDRLNLGPASASFPALKRSTTSLEVKLADDSAYTQINAINFRSMDGGGFIITENGAAIGGDRSLVAFDSGGGGALVLTGVIGWGPFGTDAGSGADTYLVRDAANVLALRNSTNAQKFSIYNTYTDASNYERGAILWDSNTLCLSAQAAGTGTQRNVLVGSSTGTGAAIRMDLGGGIHFYTTYSGNEPLTITSTGAVFYKGLSTAMVSELTIAGGVVTATGSYHNIDTEADAASDDLDTINGGNDGQRLVIRANNTARTVVVKDGTGNIQCGGDRSLDNTQDTMELIYDGTLTAWLEVAFANNGA